MKQFLEQCGLSGSVFSDCRFQWDSREVPLEDGYDATLLSDTYSQNMIESIFSQGVVQPMHWLWMPIKLIKARAWTSVLFCSFVHTDGGNIFSPQAMFCN